MGNSGQLLTMYPVSHKTVVKVSTVIILFFNITYERLFIVLIRLSQQHPIYRLRERLNCH